MARTENNQNRRKDEAKVEKVQDPVANSVF